MFKIPLRPEFLFTREHHLTATFRAGAHIPWPDSIAAAVQTQSSSLAAERWCHISNDATDDQLLNGLAVGAAHGCDVLSEQPVSLVDFGLIAALFALIFLLPRHVRLISRLLLQRYVFSDKVRRK